MKNYLLALSLILCSSKLAAQFTGNSKVNEASSVSQINNCKSQGDGSYEKNCIKWNYGMLVRGAFVINYERLITDKFTFEVGAGITYRDFLSEFSRSTGYFSTNDLKTETKIGCYFDGSFRYYFSEGLFEGVYTSPFVRYRKYNITETQEDNYNLPAGYKFTECGLLFGFQEEKDYSGIWKDIYFGLGYRILEIQDKNYSNETLKYYTESKKYKYPAILFGVKLALPF
jgi:hypothetical protein